MYGVAFTQEIDNDNVGILLFKKEAKAKMAYRVMCGMEELSSLDSNVTSILDSADVSEVPEVDDIYEEMTFVEIAGKTQLVKIINFGENEIIPDIE